MTGSIIGWVPLVTRWIGWVDSPAIREWARNFLLLEAMVGPFPDC